MKSRSKRERIWQHFKRKGDLTRWECIRKYNYVNLPGFVAVLRGQGVHVTTTEERDASKHWTRYHISKKEIKRAEEQRLVCY